MALVVAFSLMVIGCGGGGGETIPTPTITTADFFHLAIVPDQTVSTATFEVQVIAENIDPATSPSAPRVIDGSGTSHVMVLKTLKWPRTAVDSVTVYSAVIPLVTNQVNSIKVVSGIKEISFSIRHKSALSVLTASNAGNLVAHIKAAMIDPTIDVVEINYDEPDLGTVIHEAGRNAGIAITSVRTTWLTVRPAASRTVSWVRDSSGATVLARPYVDFLHLDQVTFGSDASDGAKGQFYVEDGKNAWLSTVEFRGKYKYTWSKTTPMTASYVADVRADITKGLKVYFTDCLWDGTASTNATFGAQLARDLRFNSHRGDLNDFGKVFLNATAQDISPIRNSIDTDYLHNDGFQIWGSVGTSDLIFKGLKITSPNVGADIQPFLLDRDFTPNYSGILMDSVTIEGAATALNAQLAGTIANSRISNYSFPGQTMTIRRDFSDPNGAFAPTNVRIHNFDIKTVGYFPPPFGSPATAYSSTANVADPSNAAPELNAIPGLSGAIFSNIKLN